MEIETKLGTLKARLMNSKTYPGISIGLEVGHEFIEYAWVEVDQSEWNEKPVLKIHAYNSTDDEPVFNLDQTQEDIDKYFGEG